jgi:hypothetical protein
MVAAVNEKKSFSRVLTAVHTAALDSGCTTGQAREIAETVARALHEEGYRVVLSRQESAN